MSLFTPDMYYPNIYKIPYLKLKKSGIRCLLFDLDNTCVGYHEKLPNEELKKLFKKLENLEFQVVIFSNSTKKRLKPFLELGVVCHSSSRKPFKKSFLKIMRECCCKGDEVLIIGDQLFTDILGGNRVGIRTCLVDPLTKDDLIFTKFFRMIERIIFKKMKKEKIGGGNF